MNRIAASQQASELLQDFAKTTGFDPPGLRPRRYLWTDAFAVCTYCGLFRTTGNTAFRDLACRLIDQVHHTLGRHRDDDPRAGWISGLSPEKGELHPTIGGLRIGKSLPERTAREPYDERKEWDRDGQYYHYLTKWMHALNRAGAVTGNPAYRTWAVELAQTSHARFTYRAGGRTRMYWKMSIDLSLPLVPSMGQHDPLDGLVTCAGLQTACREAGHQPVLVQEMAEMAGIVRELHLATDDPLGTGGLLSDAAVIARLASRDTPLDPDLLEAVTAAALAGLGSFISSGCLELPARYRLAFRELGLSIGLAGVEKLPAWIADNPHLSGRPSLYHRAESLRKYLPLKDKIENFWMDEMNQASDTWTEHRDISMVMLATSLAPEGFLG